MYGNNGGSSGTLGQPGITPRAEQRVAANREQEARAEGRGSWSWELSEPREESWAKEGFAERLVWFGSFVHPKTRTTTHDSTKFFDIIKKGSGGYSTFVLANHGMSIVIVTNSQSPTLEIIPA